jgi:hypothetical protein
LVLLVAGEAFALINPNFTPIDLMENSHTVLVLKMSAEKGKDSATAEVVRVVKGKGAKGDTLSVGLTECMLEEHATLLKDTVKSAGAGPILFFAGSDEAGEDSAFVQMRTLWFRLDGKGEGEYELRELDGKMQGTWAGSSDMLLRAIDYILTDPAPAVPVEVDAKWGGQKKVGTVKGKIGFLQGVDIEGRGAVCIFAASDGGDRIFGWDGAKKEFVDRTPTLKLNSRSEAAAWGDFDGDGRLDLASGGEVKVYLRQADGSFSAGAAVKVNAAGLAVMDAGTSGRVWLVAAAADGAVLVSRSDDGSFSTKPLPKGAPASDLGPAGGILAADFDGDNQPDVLQLFEKGSLLYRGKGKGEFAGAAKCDVSLGKEGSSPVVGDYDGDGMFDVMCASKEKPRLWHNAGKGKFVETVERCGSLAYISKPGSIACGTCELNNDGRQDLYLIYSGMAPQLFFNRGFRCFGYAIALNTDIETRLEEAAKGLQGGVVADFDGDGRQDIAMALPNGEVRAFLRSEEDNALQVSVGLPLKGPYAGPVTVTGWVDKRCMGSWNVVAGSSRAVFGVTEPGPCDITWRLPGGKPQKKQIIAEDKPVRVEIR